MNSTSGSGSTSPVGSGASTPRKECLAVQCVPGKPSGSAFMCMECRKEDPAAPAVAVDFDRHFIYMDGRYAVNTQAIDDDADLSPAEKQALRHRCSDLLDNPGDPPPEYDIRKHLEQTSAKFPLRPHLSHLLFEEQRKVTAKAHAIVGNPAFDTETKVGVLARANKDATDYSQHIIRRTTCAACACGIVLCIAVPLIVLGVLGKLGGANVMSVPNPANSTLADFHATSSVGSTDEMLSAFMLIGAMALHAASLV